MELTPAVVDCSLTYMCCHRYIDYDIKISRIVENYFDQHIIQHTILVIFNKFYQTPRYEIKRLERKSHAV